MVALYAIDAYMYTAGSSAQGFPWVVVGYQVSRLIIILIIIIMMVAPRSSGFLVFYRIWFEQTVGFW